MWRSSAGKPLARVGSTTGTSYTDTVAGAKTTYTYVIRAYDGAANPSKGVGLLVLA